MRAIELLRLNGYLLPVESRLVHIVVVSARVLGQDWALCELETANLWLRRLELAAVEGVIGTFGRNIP